MFPSFVSILDIQSWWEIPSIAHFCSLFRVAFNLLDFDIEDLEEALLSDDTEENSWLQELIVRLLRGCLVNHDISTINYQMFLRRLFRQKCQEDPSFSLKNPFDSDIDFQFLPLRTKVEILQTLCDFRLEAEDVLDHLKTFEADSLRIEPLGYDSKASAYWYFYGTRLYREDYPLDKGGDFETRQYKNLIKKKSVWQVICFSEQDWQTLTEKFRHTLNKSERQLYEILRENFLPELPKLFAEKDRLHRKRVLERRIPLRSEQLFLKKIEDETDQSRPNSISGSEEHNSDQSMSDDQSSYDSDSRKMSKKTVTVGRQTNNSLSAATGNIFIRQTADNSKRKKLKTSQVFMQSDEDLQIGLHKILEYLKNHEDAWPFTDPVEEEYAPGYYSIIRKPMDLQKMEEKLDTGEYSSFSTFKADFQLIVDNCYLYNGSHNEYAEMVDSLQEAFKIATDRFLDNGSSDEEIAVEFQDPKITKTNNHQQHTHQNHQNQSIGRKRRKNRKIPKSLPRLRVQKKINMDTQSESDNGTKNASGDDTDDDELFDYVNNYYDDDNKDTEEEENVGNGDGDGDEVKNENIKDDSSDSNSDKKTDKKFGLKFEKWKDQKINKNYKFNLMKVAKGGSKAKESNKKLLETIEKLKSKAGPRKDGRYLDSSDDNLSKNNSSSESNKNDRQASKSTKKHKRKKVKVNVQKRLKSNAADTVPTMSRLRMRRPRKPSVAVLGDDQEFDRNRKKRRKATFVPSPHSLSSASSRSSSRSSVNSCDDNRLDGKKDDKLGKDLLPKDLKKRQLMFRDLMKNHKKQKLINKVHSTKKINKTPAQPKPPTKVEVANQMVLNKIRDMKNALNEKTSKIVDGGSKLSLGTVLESFGPEDGNNNSNSSNKFPGDESKLGVEPKKSIDEKTDDGNNEVAATTSEKIEEEPEDEIIIIKKPCQEKATPNLSAWFKAFGGPKSTSSPTVQSTPPVSTSSLIKKKVEPEPLPVTQNSAPPIVNTQSVVSGVKPKIQIQVPTVVGVPTVEKVLTPQPSPLAADSLSPMPRQRRCSTGSSSSFSQDLDSPRVSVDERLSNNPYSVPFPSPLYKSPMAVSPSMQSPKSDDYVRQNNQQLQSPFQAQSQSQPQSQSQSHSYNSNIRVGFYQDTTASIKSSPEKEPNSLEVTPNSSPYQSHYHDSVYGPGLSDGSSSTITNSMNATLTPSSSLMHHSHQDSSTSYQTPLFPFDTNFYQNNCNTVDNDRRISPDFTKKQRGPDSAKPDSKTDNANNFLLKTSSTTSTSTISTHPHDSYSNFLPSSQSHLLTTGSGSGSGGNNNSSDRDRDRNQCNILESQHFGRSDLQPNDLSLRFPDNRLLKMGHIPNTQYVGNMANSTSTNNNNNSNNLRLQDRTISRLNNLTNIPQHIVDHFSNNLSNSSPAYYSDNNLHHLPTPLYPVHSASPMPETTKKTRKPRKSKNTTSTASVTSSTATTTITADNSTHPSTHRPFMVPNSLEPPVTPSKAPNNNFNFNPSTPSLFTSDPSYLEDFHNNYYMSPHHRSEVMSNPSTDKSGSGVVPPSFFTATNRNAANFAPHAHAHAHSHPHPHPSPFMNPHSQAPNPLLDHNSPLYQQYLLHQGILRGGPHPHPPPQPTNPTHAYNAAASYHAAAALSMRQPYDPIRPTWL